MPRKGENIYKRKDNRWEGRYITTYNAAGRAVYKSVYGKTYTEVKLKMKSHVESERIKAVSISFVSWAEQYLKSQAENLKIGTYNIYKRYIKNHIKPFFGNTALRKMNSEIVQAFVNSLSGLAPSTVKGIFSFLRETLKKANKENYIAPIWLDIELPKAKRHEVEVFSREEQKRIESSLNIEENPNDIGILICLYTGLRIGEVCGLKWKDIDFKNGNMYVNRTVQRVTIDGKSVLRELPPKSETSRRKIPIPSCLLDKLKTVRKPRQSAYVLHTDYHMMDTRTFQYQYKKTLERAGVRYANAHTLRHTFSVRALELGFDIKTLSEILGHADATITLRIYAHSHDEHKRNSMAKFEQIV